MGGTLLVRNFTITVIFFAVGCSSQDAAPQRRTYSSEIKSSTEDQNLGEEKPQGQKPSETDTTKDPNSSTTTSTESPSGESGSPTTPPNSGSGSATTTTTTESGAAYKSKVEVTSLGTVTGFAYDDKDQNKILSVRLTVDLEIGGGNDLDIVKADNGSFSDGGARGSHAFKIDLPEKFRDGKAHKMFLYVIDADGKPVKSPTSYSFAAYAPSADGRAFYNANVASGVGGCGGCHSWNYESLFYVMLTPSPFEGGTARNNSLINRLSYSNGITSHRGGKICNSPDTGVCAAIQNWWKNEFE